MTRVHGIRLALRDAEFTDGKLAHRLLVHELRTSVDRAFGTASCGHGHAGTGPMPGGPYAPPGGPGAPLPPEPPRRDGRGLIAGCAVWAGLACTCQMCCGTFEDPWSRQRREGLCNATARLRDCCNCCELLRELLWRRLRLRGCDGCDCSCNC